MNTEQIPTNNNDEPTLISLPSERFHQALDTLELAFPDISRTFFHAITLRDPNYNPVFSLAISKGNRILSYLQIFDRTMNINGQTVRVGGIGSVGTRPQSQGQGYSSQLIKEAINVMESAGMQASYLFTYIHPFYERFGWQTLEQNEDVIPITNLKHLRPSFREYRRIAEEDCETIKAIYNQRAQQYTGHILRSNEYWDNRPSWMNHIPTVVLSEGKVVGYFYMTWFKKKRPVLSITEYGYANPDEKTLKLLLGAMARKAEEMSCQSISGFFHNDRHLGPYLDHHKWIEKTIPHNYVMWRDLDGFSHLPTIQSQINENRFIHWQTDAF